MVSLVASTFCAGGCPSRVLEPSLSPASQGSKTCPNNFSFQNCQAWVSAVSLTAFFLLLLPYPVRLLRPLGSNSLIARLSWGLLLRSLQEPGPPGHQGAGANTAQGRPIDQFVLALARLLSPTDGWLDDHFRLHAMAPPVSPEGSETGESLPVHPFCTFCASDMT